MINQEQRQLIKQVINILLRRKIIILVCLFFALVIGLGYYLKAPKVYRSVSLITYQRSFLTSEMAPRMGSFEDMVANVSQQIISRSSLESMITQFNLYPGMRARLPMEDVIDNMRKKDISIRPSRNGNTFTVSYKGPVPRTVLLVTNALAAKFIEENIRLREETVSETSSYIKDELNMAKNALNKKEAAMREYRLKYYNEMPQKLSSNISRLNALQSEYQGYQNSLQELERTKVLLQEQVSLRREFLSQAGSGAVSTPDQLYNLRMQLESLQTKYTDKHPDVKNLKNLIAKMEQDDSEKDPETGSETDSPDIRLSDPQLAKMQQQLDDIDYNMSLINREKEETRKQIDQYKKWIEATPLREAEWSDLTSGYEQLNSYYQGLISRDIMAESAASLERRQKGSQFKIVDPANFPVKPYSPDFLQIMLMALGLGLAAGGVLGLGLELLDTSFRDAHDLEKFLNLPVACAIPVIRTEKEQRRERLKSTIWFFTLFLSYSALCGSVAFLWFKGIVII